MKTIKRADLVEVARKMATLNSLDAADTDLLVSTAESVDRVIDSGVTWWDNVLECGCLVGSIYKDTPDNEESLLVDAGLSYSSYMLEFVPDFARPGSNGVIEVVE